ncbi:hypothetical protein CTEN210_04196 [Chaetoceros tenuissimus]|uniref:Methyltransferase FkbM domain-containing protein n=1 Tax=Chaetoceros tenuissimus TaxID=426638 RepID=A0AAD3CMM6_9STRA|nr:hypothetical protein CTEN210_04196 [Chaetoceros tenuissimus]
MPINRRKAEGYSGSNKERDVKTYQKDTTSTREEGTNSSSASNVDASYVQDFSKKNSPKLLHAILSFLFFPVLFHTYSATNNSLVLSTNISSSSSSHQCSYNELLQIRSQLVPELCVNNHERKTYWVQQCSLTVATKCPLATWLTEYYNILFSSHSSVAPFYGISIGCNSHRAIHHLKLATGDDRWNVTQWDAALSQESNHSIVNTCSSLYQVDATLEESMERQRRGEFICAEPDFKSFHYQRSVSKSLGYKELGFKIKYDPTYAQKGNRTDTVQKNKAQTSFELNKISKRRINVLRIDIQGYEADILFNTSSTVLRNVEYLEFGYHWSETWQKYHLYDVIEMLRKLHFTCYWAGDDRLWKITGCWMSYFDIKTWANIACVNVKKVPVLASIMENKFQNTLSEDKQWYWQDPKYPWKRIVKRAQFQVKDHVLMSTDEEQLKKKYIDG